MAFPRYTGVAALAVLFSATGIYGAALGGHGQAALEAVGSAVGFPVNDVNITGNVETSEIDVLQQLGLDGDTSLLTIDAHAARDQLVKLPWVADAEVRKVYPGSLNIHLRERKAFAIWQHAGQLSLIERSGRVIAPFVQGTKFAALPLYVGRGAQEKAAAFNDLLSAWPDLVHRAKAVVRVDDRRWNLVFDNNVTLKLPHEHVAQALEDFDVMEKQRDVLDHDIVAVDLRLADRITVQLSPAAAERRREAIADRDKMLEKQEKNAWEHENVGKQV
ncbi:cell division protein FtsQ/DivIB [Pararhizobium mangrovi]|uniref:cell division protein FtsQ/DivIB n=1 Tax=Pararhizobium mangrovi TaxID=2590452 RepID=UPI001F15C7B7|nr:cell division protein FtsQ/DivIB [Pararhizobium mangrovi]